MSAVRGGVLTNVPRTPTFYKRHGLNLDQSLPQQTTPNTCVFRGCLFLGKIAGCVRRQFIVGFLLVTFAILKVF